MNNFYVSMIFIGILLIVASLIWVAFEKKSSFSYMNKLEGKKQDMVAIIGDAEQMIEELNKFSDYIVTQMDLKNLELQANLKNAGEEIQQLQTKFEEKLAEISQTAAKATNLTKTANSANSASETVDFAATARIVNGNSPESKPKYREHFLMQTSDLVIENSGKEQIPAKKDQRSKPASRKSEKVVSMSNRYDEVLKLSTDGLNDTEIAKRLNMGKGEIQLILGLNRS